MLFVFNYVYQCPTRFPYHMMFVLYNNNTIGITGRAGSANRSRAHEFIPHFYRCFSCSMFSFLCSVLQIIICPFLIGFCIVCPSIYDFGIFKLILHVRCSVQLCVSRNDELLTECGEWEMMHWEPEMMVSKSKHSQ